MNSLKSFSFILIRKWKLTDDESIVLNYFHRLKSWRWTAEHHRTKTNECRSFKQIFRHLLVLWDFVMEREKWHQYLIHKKSLWKTTKHKSNEFHWEIEKYSNISQWQHPTTNWRSKFVWFRWSERVFQHTRTVKSLDAVRSKWYFPIVIKQRSWIGPVWPWNDLLGELSMFRSAFSLENDETMKTKWKSKWTFSLVDIPSMNQIIFSNWN